MNIESVKKVIPYILKANLSPNLVGEPGTGKTSVFKQFVEDGGHKMEIVNLGNQDVGDLIGLADFLLDDEGNKVATKFMMPTWAKNLIEFANNNPDKYSILFLDEINRAARRDVLQAIFPLMLEKRLHDTQFPSNFRVVSAMNPGGDDDFVTELGEALLSRFCHIKFTSSLDSFIKYGDSNDVDPNILLFLQDQPEMLIKKSDFNIPERKPDNRAWEMVSDLMKTGIDKNLLQECCYGIVGQVATIAFIKSLNSGDKPLSAKDVLDDFDRVKQSKIKGYSDDVKNRRLDILKYTIDAIIKVIDSDKVLDKGQIDNLSKFILMIPKDMGYDMLRNICNKNSNYYDVFEKNDKINQLAENSKNIRAK